MLQREPSGARADQAAGLRSLLKRRALRALPVFGDGDARSQGAVSIELCRALAHCGHAVVLLDMSGEALRAAGVEPAHELVDLVEGTREFAEVAVPLGAGLRGVAAMRGLPALIEAGCAGEDFFAGFLRLDDPAAFVVINMRPLIGPDGRLWLPRIGASGECLMVMSDGERSLTAAYAQIKQACQPGDAGYGELPAFRVLVHGADGERVARTACRQLADTARRFLGATVAYAGNVPSARPGGTAAQRARGRRTAEAGRVYLRLATDLPGWRLAECTDVGSDPGLAH